MTRADTPDTMPEHIGPYRLVRALGKGGMGVVYEGVDTRLNRRVAIKTARMDRIDPSDQEARERFLREARAAAALNHPGIITIYEADEWEGGLFIAMEFVEGTDLAGWVRRNGPPTVEQAVNWLATLSETLAFAHRRGIVHRDIKPANILIPDEGHLKITDFGIARLESSTLTQEGAILGTPNYMSPEQFLGRKADGRADLFSLAVVGYELLTGTRPFTGDSFTAIMHHVLHTPPVPPDMLNPDIGAPLRDVLLKALSKAPSERFPDGEAFAAALRDALSTRLAPIPEAPTVVISPGENPAETLKNPAPAGIPALPDAPTVRADSNPVATRNDVTATAPTERYHPPEAITPERAVSNSHPNRSVSALAVAAVLLAGVSVALFLLDRRQPEPTPSSVTRSAPASASHAVDLAPVTPAEPATDTRQAGPETAHSSSIPSTPDPMVRIAYYLYQTESPEVFRGFPVSPDDQGAYL
ncbi:MAG TPA: protein kinase, partial [Candidatus Hydrogenedentes bacterium]|nr:protein kinase [Candidatus Hydrogenedentota bacterium]